MTKLGRWAHETARNDPRTPVAGLGTSRSLFADILHLAGRIVERAMPIALDAPGELVDTFLFDEWIGVPEVFEFMIVKKGIAINEDGIVKLIASIGNISTITDIDEDKVFDSGNIVYAPWIKFRIGGTTAYFPVEGSENWTLSGKQTTWPRLILNILIILVMMLAIVLFGPKIIGLLKKAFPQLMTLTLTAYSAVKDAMWKTDVMERFGFIDKDLGIVNTSLDNLGTVLAGYNADVINKVESSETDLKTYLAAGLEPDVVTLLSKINDTLIEMRNVALKIGLGL